VGPFFAALLLAVLLALASVLGLSDMLPGAASPLGTAALTAFVWSTLPAVLTALVLAAVVLRTGTLTWIVAGPVAVIAFAVAAVLLPAGLEDARPYLAFLAGLVSIGVREVLVRAGIIPD
jgi:hypothetical protein